MEHLGGTYEYRFDKERMVQFLKSIGKENLLKYGYTLGWHSSPRYVQKGDEIYSVQVGIKFTLVVSADEQPDSNIQDLIDYIEYYQGKSEKSEISSIYDLLYEDYTQELLLFYKTHKRVSDYDSENLTYWAIHDTIKEQGFAHLGILMHYPLRHLVTSASNLTPEQRVYASRSWRIPFWHPSAFHFSV